MQVELLFARGAKRDARARRQLAGPLRHLLFMLSQSRLHLRVFTHHLADNRRRVQVFCVGFVARLQQQDRGDLLQRCVNTGMAAAVGNDQIRFQCADGFQARLSPRADRLPGFQMCAHLRQDAIGIVIVCDADRADVHGRECIGERQFQHHNPLRGVIQREGALFVLNRSGNGLAGEQHQAGKEGA
ncbi:hypothetical protein D3C75_972110 [compost metagenome]